MKESFNNLEKGMKESLNDFELPFDKKHWEEFEMRLEGKSASSLNTVAAAIVSAVILMSGITYIILSPAISDSAQEVSEVLEERPDFSLNTLDYDEVVLESRVISLDDGKVALDDGHTVMEEVSNDIDNINKEISKAEVQNTIQEKENTSRANYVPKEEFVEEIEQLEEKSIEEIEKNESPMSTLPFIISSAVEICAGEKIEFKTENISEAARFLWNFGNANFSTETNPVRTFNEPGEYNVTLILSKSTEKIESKIIVLPKPTAKFAWNEGTKGQVKFSNLSEKADASYWQIDDEFTSNDINPTFEYSKAGKKLVTLKVQNEFGCSDSSFRYIKLAEPLEVLAPSAIAQAENFLPSLSDPNYGQLMFTIHNMKGQLIYESEEGQPWTGTMPDGTYAAPDSEFAWLVLVKNHLGKEIYSDSGKVKILP
ncbi:MAG: PKD domain-containing protein [Flavobacteriales bacterium]